MPVINAFADSTAVGKGGCLGAPSSSSAFWPAAKARTATYSPTSMGSWTSMRQSGRCVACRW